MSFSLYALACSRILKDKTRIGAYPDPGRMQSLQSKDDSVLKLHSCQSSIPQTVLAAQHKL